MERPLFGFALECFLVVSLGLVSFTLCIVAELKKSKRKDLRLDGELCYLPGSDSFGFGIAALVCLFIAQMVGSFIIWKKSCLGHRSGCKARKPTLSSLFLSLSWISFGIALILLGTATSMSQKQAIGQGWLDGDCYTVKNGIYGGSGILVLISVTCTLVSGILTQRKSQVGQVQKVHHAQVV